jgi:hypothetical protein
MPEKNRDGKNSTSERGVGLTVVLGMASQES